MLQPVAQKAFTVVIAASSAIFWPRKKVIAKKIVQTMRAIMISQDIDLVAGDFNGTAWRCRSRDNLSTIDEVFSDCTLPTPAGPTPLWGPGSIPNNWADVCGFLKQAGSQRFWKVNKHGAFSIPRKALGLTLNDQSCHHETWLHLHFVDWNNKWNHQAHYNGNIRPQGTTSEFWLRSSKTSYQRCVERPLALGMSAQPLALPGCCVLPWSSSRSDLMRFGVIS